MSNQTELRDLTPDEVHDALQQHRITLIDVREPAEFAAERIHGVLLHPLSTFDPLAFPADPARPLVFHCGTGKRSAMAVARCREMGVGVSAHLNGGLAAWKAAGMPVVSIDAATGAVQDRR